MKVERFTTVLLEGPKEAAVEVPFDPATRWGLPATRLPSGRHGHRVRGLLNRLPVESAIVTRAEGFFLLIPDETRRAAGLNGGDMVQVTLQPQALAGSSRPASPARRHKTRSTSPD